MDLFAWILSKIYRFFFVRVRAHKREFLVMYIFSTDGTRIVFKPCYEWRNIYVDIAFDRGFQRSNEVGLLKFWTNYKQIILKIVKKFSSRG